MAKYQHKNPDSGWAYPHNGKLEDCGNTRCQAEFRRLHGISEIQLTDPRTDTVKIDLPELRTARPNDTVMVMVYVTSPDGQRIEQEYDALTGASRLTRIGHAELVPTGRLAALYRKGEPVDGTPVPAPDGQTPSPDLHAALKLMTTVLSEMDSKMRDLAKDVRSVIGTHVQQSLERGYQALRNTVDVGPWPTLDEVPESIYCVQHEETREEFVRSNESETGWIESYDGYGVTGSQPGPYRLRGVRYQTLQDGE